MAADNEKMQVGEERGSGKWREAGQGEGGEEGSLPFCSRGTGGNIRWGRRSEWSRTGLHLKKKNVCKKENKNKQVTDVNTVTRQYLHNKRNQG